jgi:hypothetical protein
MLGIGVTINHQAKLGNSLQSDLLGSANNFERMVIKDGRAHPRSLIVKRSSRTGS